MRICGSSCLPEDLSRKKYFPRAISIFNQRIQCTSVMRCVDFLPTVHLFVCVAKETISCISLWLLRVFLTINRQKKRFFLLSIYSLRIHIILFRQQFKTENKYIKMKFSAAVILASVGYTNAFSGSS
jgi:hypothetical protein